MTVTHDTLLTVENLAVSFDTRAGRVVAVDDVSFCVDRGEIVGVVGESGSGKSVSSLALMGLLDGNGRIDRGAMQLRGERLGESRAADFRLRGEMAMIFQYPRMALNPICQVGRQIIDVLKAAGVQLDGEGYRQRAIELMEEVNIYEPEQRFAAYPFELSGGMCQRILIAMALARKPALLIADEPTTGLDVVTQEAILALIVEATKTRRMGTMFITHDLALAAKYATRIYVMRRGKVVEHASAEQLFRAPGHTYTRNLIAATPALMSSLNDLRQVMYNSEASHEPT